MPKRPDEIALWNSFGQGAEPINGLYYHWVRDAAQALGIPHKRAEYLCIKWAEQGIYEYGVSAQLGWKVDLFAQYYQYELSYNVTARDKVTDALLLREKSANLLIEAQHHARMAARLKEQREQREAALKAFVRDLSGR